MSANSADIETCRDLVTVMTSIVTKISSASSASSSTNNFDDTTGSGILLGSSIGGGNGSSSQTHLQMLERWRNIANDVTSSDTCSDAINHIVTNLTKVVESVTEMSLVTLSPATRSRAGSNMPGGGPGGVPLSSSLNVAGGPPQGRTLSPSPQSASLLPAGGSDSRQRFFERKGIVSAPRTPNEAQSPEETMSSGHNSPPPSVTPPPHPSSSHQAHQQAVYPPPPPPPPHTGRVSPQAAALDGSWNHGRPVVVVTPQSNNDLGNGMMISGPRHDEAVVVKPKAKQSLTRAPKESSLEGGLADEDCEGFKLT